MADRTRGEAGHREHQSRHCARYSQPTPEPEGHECLGAILVAAEQAVLGCRDVTIPGIRGAIFRNVLPMMKKRACGADG